MELERENGTKEGKQILEKKENIFPFNLKFRNREGIAEKFINFQFRLVQLKEKWVWSDKNLKLAGIGNPKKLIKNLLMESSSVKYLTM